MKAYYLIASLAASALGGCAVYPAPVAYQQPTVVTTPATVTPAYVAPSGSAVIVR
jgi:hypothetical protein